MNADVEECAPNRRLVKVIVQVNDGSTLAKCNKAVSDVGLNMSTTL
jgi:hypothetical protein